MPLLPLPDELLLLENLDDTEDPCDDEELLALPLDFTSYEVDAYELKVLAAYELKLRIGLAFNLLGDVCEAVKHTAAHGTPGAQKEGIPCEEGSSARPI